MSERPMADGSWTHGAVTGDKDGQSGGCPHNDDYGTTFIMTGHCILCGAERVATPSLADENRAMREALERIAAMADGQEGRTAQTMMMHGFSPVKALGEAIGIAKSTLASLSPPSTNEPEG